MINGQMNCSSGNICGSYGYCYVENGQMQCECKFWWVGKLCNQQSDSGKQVITLGCLTAAIIFIFFGLKIARFIYNKSKKPKEIEIKEISKDPKLLSIAIEYVKKSTSLSSCLITILMIIVAGTTLVAKWSLLQPIHDEIVEKYNNNSQIYFEKRSFCAVLELREFNVITFPVACLLVIICIVLTKRASFMKNICYGYGGPPTPVNFLSHLDRKFVAVIFAIIADELLGIVEQIVGSSDNTNGILVKFLKRVFQVLIMGFRFYPILAAVYINSIFILICATIYAWLDYSLTIVTQGMCEPDYYPDYNDHLNDPSDIQEKLDYFGTGPSLIALQLCADIPRYLCLAYISIKLPMMVIEKIRDQRKKDLSDEKKMLMSLTREENILLSISDPDSVEMLYVRNLFRSANERPRSQALFARLIPKIIYEWRDDFRFSSRILCIYSSISLLLFLITISAFAEVLPILHDLQLALQDIINTITTLIPLIRNMFSDNVANKDGIATPFPVPNLVRSYICAVAMTVTIIVIQLIILLANIRRNLLQLYRGDDSEIPRRQQSRYVSYATGNFHFAGYFFGYLIWGFVIIAIFSAIVCICIDAFITYGSVRAIEKVLKAIIPSLLLVIFKQFLNRLLAQYVFLQHYGDVLALDNRRYLMIFIYFNFFLDAFLGFVSSILRLIISIIGGILYMCRLDYSPLGRKLERLDSGFNSYCGFIHTECTHRHPVMLVFVSHLFNQIKKRQYIMKQIQSDDLVIQEKYLMESKKSLRYIRKWRLAAFLIRNPFILFYRKTFLTQLHPEQRRAINDIDNNDQKNIKHGLALYMRQMAALRPNFLLENDPSQIKFKQF